MQLWKVEVMVGVKTGMIWPNINLWKRYKFEMFSECYLDALRVEVLLSWISGR